MAEWLVEEGIGETRYLLVENGEAIAAKLHWPGEVRAGETVGAKLVSKASGARRGVALTSSGREVLLDRLPAEVAEGEQIAVRISRAPIAERGRLKRAQGVLVESGTAADSHKPEGKVVRSFPPGLWEEIWDDAAAGEVAFAAGTLLFSVTPAMTLVDVDGDLPPRELALAAVEPLARAIRRFDLGGSIGIDFPTLDSKAERKAVDAELEAALADWDHERTAMNGFGFVQIVARLEGPSLLHRMATSRVGAAARMVLRRAERLDGAGRRILLTVHPAVKAKLKVEWLDELARRTGREILVESDPGIAIGANHAQLLSDA